VFDVLWRSTKSVCCLAAFTLDLDLYHPAVRCRLLGKTHRDGTKVLLRKIRLPVLKGGRKASWVCSLLLGQQRASSMTPGDDTPLVTSEASSCACCALRWVCECSKEMSWRVRRRLPTVCVGRLRRDMFVSRLLALLWGLVRVLSSSRRRSKTT
jgi:hypothetical protein